MRGEYVYVIEFVTEAELTHNRAGRLDVWRRHRKICTFLMRQKVGPWRCMRLLSVRISRDPLVQSGYQMGVNAMVDYH